MKRILVLPILLLLLSLAAVPLTAQSPPPLCTAVEQVLPAGQISPSPDNDPLLPIYCLPDAVPHAPTGVSGLNDWIDTFGVTARLNDGDMGYRVFDGGGVGRTAHQVNGDHWMSDVQTQYGGGTYLSPNRSFHFEGNPPKLVIEGDASAGKEQYRGNMWTEIEFSTANRPDISLLHPDFSYGYGRFYTNYVIGCRMQGENIVCAYHQSTDLTWPPTNDNSPCYSNGPDRPWELSYFQDCGNNFGGVHFYNFADQTARKIFRLCPSTQVPPFTRAAELGNYDACLDRFRMEISQHSLVVYVNGVRYFEDTGWDAIHSLGADFLTRPIYVYYADWGLRSPPPPGGGPSQTDIDQVYRFHWGRLAVNPHDASGNILPPSASPSFGQAAPASTPVPATPIATQSPTTASTVAPTDTPTPTVFCQVSVELNGTPGPYRPC